MPKRCIAAGCSTSSREGYSLHAFPRDDDLHKKWTRAVKQHQSNWKVPRANSLPCSKHFKQECFAVEGSCYRDTMCIPAKKCLKPDAIPTIFPKSIHGGSSTPTAPVQRPTSEKRQQKAVSNQHARHL